MKKRIVLLMTLMIAIIATGCGQETTPTAVPDASVDIEEVGQEPEEETAVEPVNVAVFYSNAQADGFEQKEVQIEGLTPENLIDELAKVNVVSIDTEVNSFEQEGDSLKLDLSKGFSQYVNMMGTSGEYIVMGGLVNTFLTAYDGKDILITVEGKTLETNHAIYDKPLNFYEINGETEDEPADGEEKEPMSYRLKDEAYDQSWAEVYYPQFTDMSDKAIQDEWNEVIRKITVGAAEESKTKCDSYNIDYQIASCDTEFVSFVFTREIDAEGSKTKDFYAISFDMVERKNVRLSDWGEAMDTAAYNLSNHGYYKILSDDVDRETYDDYMKAILPGADEYKKEFLQYDFDLEDLEKQPAGTSYVEDGKLILIMEVPEILGGTLKIDTGIEVRE